MEILSTFAMNDTDMSWQDEAACKGLGVDFFPEVGFNKMVKVALAVCAKCPVRERCLQFALDNKIEHGIWGGKTAANRSTIRRYKYKHVRNGKVYVPQRSTVIP